MVLDLKITDSKRRLFSRYPLMFIGGGLLLIMVFLAVFAPLLFTSDPIQMNPVERLKTPSLIHWFGTDMFGRDIYSRTVYGSRISLVVGLVAAVLSVIYIALIARITRASMLEVLEEDYIRTARAKGQTESRVLISHALKNASIPIVTIIGIGIALLIGGVVVTESVYNIPGLGRLVVDAILKRDYPIIQGLILMFSFVYIIINLVIDILYTILDPRIRY